jgi:predicted ATPase
MARWKNIGVSGFKSIRDLQTLQIKPVNVLVGANGAGKSNLISFFRLLASIPVQKLQYFVARAGGADTLLYHGPNETIGFSASLDFEGEAGDAKYFFHLVSNPKDALFFAEERVTHDGEPMIRVGSGHYESQILEDERSRELRDLLIGIQAYHFEDTSGTSPIRRRVYVEDNRSLRSDAGNLAAFLYGLRHREPLYYRRIVSTIQQIAPFFDDFDLAPMAEDQHSIILNWKDRDSDHIFGPHQLSDGTLRSMALVALLAQPESDLPGLIVIDESEIGLHPYALDILAALVKRASHHTQIILATQSVTLVNQFKPEDVITVTREKAQSKFERHDSASLAAWLDEYSIGDIWEKNVIGGTPLS